MTNFEKWKTNLKPEDLFIPDVYSDCEKPKLNDIQHTLWYGDAKARGAFFDKLENALCLAWDIAFFESQSEQIPSYKVAIETKNQLSDLISNVRKARAEYMKEVERKEKEKQEKRSGSYYSPHQETHEGWFRGL